MRYLISNALPFLLLWGGIFCAASVGVLRSLRTAGVWCLLERCHVVMFAVSTIGSLIFASLLIVSVSLGMFASGLELLLVGLSAVAAAVSVQAIRYMAALMGAAMGSS